LALDAAGAAGRQDDLDPRVAQETRRRALSSLDETASTKTPGVLGAFPWSRAAMVAVPLLLLALGVWVQPRVGRGCGHASTRRASAGATDDSIAIRLDREIEHRGAALERQVDAFRSRYASDVQVAQVDRAMGRLQNRMSEFFGECETESAGR
jgi:hypothetical protein